MVPSLQGRKGIGLVPRLQTLHGQYGDDLKHSSSVATGTNQGSLLEESVHCGSVVSAINFLYIGPNVISLDAEW